MDSTFTKNKAGCRKSSKKDKSKENAKELMDLVEKEFEAYPDTAADIINVLLYDGDRSVEVKQPVDPR